MLDLTWSCMVCGRVRPDEQIGVHSTTQWIGAVPVQRNVRYCNDRPDCIAGAVAYDWAKPRPRAPRRPLWRRLLGR